MSVQDSSEAKAQWLEWAKKQFPYDAKVKVVRSEVDMYVGKTGTVLGYDTGLKGEYPMVSIKFDVPIQAKNGPIHQDSFYADGNDHEIERVE